MMHVLWINEAASFIGGCEGYIYNTVGYLKHLGIKSTLLYNPLLQSNETFLNKFDAAFPIVNLEMQLNQIPHDLIYLHQLSDIRQLHILGQTKAPVIKFFHDHQLFCLRGDKLPYFSNQACKNPVGCRCYPLGFTVVRRKNFIGIGLKSLWELKRAQKLHQQFAGYITASRYMSSEAVMTGFSSNKILSLPLYPFNAGNQEKQTRMSHQLLFVGQLIRSKGLDVLLQAMTLLPEKYCLQIAGQGNQEADYRKLVTAYKLDERVQFLGHLSQQELAQYYLTCGCVVIPSRWPEPFGLVGIEAMQFGSPVVASAVGGIPEWLEDGKNGILVPSNDPAALAEGIRKIGDNPALGQSMGQYGADFAKANYSIEQHCQKLQEYFQVQIKRNTSWGRFTHFGSESLEGRLTEMVSEIAALIRSEFTSDSYIAALVVGSYGKGEGGVESRDGKERPHNNLDLLLVSPINDPALLLKDKAKLDTLLLSMTEKYGLGFDTSFVSENKMKNMNPTLLWYELYHGHKCILGDSHFVPSLPLGDLKRVSLSEIQALMVNRGTLLIINDCILQSTQNLSQKLQKVIIKHIMKAIIGFGDALLYYLDDYHWSYLERKKRLQSQKRISPEFRLLYAMAAEFRFQPDYTPYMSYDLKGWMQEVRKQIEKVYLECEGLRIGMGDLQADSYAETALRYQWREKFTGIQQWLRRWRGLSQPTASFIGKSLKAKIAFLGLSRRERLAYLFPLVAFGSEDPLIRKQAAQFLGSPTSEPKDLSLAYLKQWSHLGDINFKRSQSEWGIQLIS